MAVSSLVTGGIGPESSVPLLLTGGLAIGDGGGEIPAETRQWNGGMMKKLGRFMNPAIVLALFLFS